MRQKIGIFLFGAVGYASIEVICRGRTHWSMMLAGGLCLLVLSLLSERMQGRGILLQALVGAVAVTAIELTFGIVVNLWLGWKVWDYAARPLNLLGQICPQYFLLWLLISLAGIVLDDWLRFWWWGEERPRYKLF